MQKFPVLKTSLKGFILEPLDKKHSQFLVTLLNTPSIQKTLYRSPRVVLEDSFIKSYEAMYANPAREITYILTLSQQKKKIPFGYVKVKLIEWASKSCYLSIAMLDDAVYRGKGYSTICYNAFFKFLFSIGFLKIYGRTYEENIPTIKLNFRTGFRVIGRQKHFVIQNNNTSQDALFFEKLHPAIDSSYENIHTKRLLPLYQRLKNYLSTIDSIATLEIPQNIKTEISKWFQKKGKYIPKFEYKKDKIQHFLNESLLFKNDLVRFQKSEGQQLPADWQQYLNRMSDFLDDRINLAKSINTPKYRTYNKSFYSGEIPNKYFTEAAELATLENVSPESQSSGAKVSLHALSLITKTINREFLEQHFKINLSPRTSPGGIDFTKGVLSVSSIHHWSKNQLISFLVHESVHALVSYNAYKSGFYLLSAGFTPGYLAFQEGLAMYLTYAITGDQLPITKASIYWRVRKYADTIPVYDLYNALQEDSVLKKLDFEQQKEMLVRLWKAQKETYAIPTYKRLAYVPAYLYINDFLKDKHPNDFLWAPLAASDYSYLFSQFIGRDVPFDVFTLIRIKNRASELLMSIK